MIGGDEASVVGERREMRRDHRLHQDAHLAAKFGTALELRGARALLRKLQRFGPVDAIKSRSSDEPVALHGQRLVRSALVPVNLSVGIARRVQ